MPSILVGIRKKKVFLLAFFNLVYNHLICSLKVLTEYVLVSVTSAVTVTIAGIVKEAVTILVLISHSIVTFNEFIFVHAYKCDLWWQTIQQVAVLFFNDPFTWLKGFGLATIIFGVSLFNLYKWVVIHFCYVQIFVVPS